MNNKGKGKALQESPEERNIFEENFITDLKEQSDDQQSNDSQSDDQQFDDQYSDDQQSDDQQFDDQDSDDQQSDNQQSDDPQSEDQQSDDQQSEEQSSDDDQQSDDQQFEEQQSDDLQSDDQQSDDEQSDDQQSDDQQSDNQYSDDQQFHNQQFDDHWAVDKPYFGVKGPRKKRKQSSLPEEMNDGDPPVFDFRSIPIRKELIKNVNQIDQLNPSSQCYPYLVQEKYLKDWEEILLLADSQTKTAIQEIVKCADLLDNLEKKIEEAKDSIAQLINFEKENSEIIENMSSDLESMTRKIEKLKDYSRQVVQRHENSLLYYAEKFEQKSESDDDYDVQQPEPTEEEKESPGKEEEEVSKEENSENSDAVSRP